MDFSFWWSPEFDGESPEFDEMDRLRDTIVHLNAENEGLRIQIMTLQEEYDFEYKRMQKHSLLLRKELVDLKANVSEDGKE